MIHRILGDTALFLERNMDYAAKRHSLLASNVANIDTPGYVPSDLVFGDALQEKLQLAQPEGAHLDSEAPDFEQVYDVTTAPGFDGNAVDLDREMAKMAANGQKFAIAGRMISKKIALLRYAIDGDR